MRLSTRKLLIFIALAFICHAPVLIGENKKVVAHYMEWFKWRQDRTRLVIDHWQWTGKDIKHDPRIVKDNGLRDVSSAFYPVIGPYDSQDDDVIEYHILTAKACGIDGFVVDWYGTNGFVDRTFSKMIDIAQKYHFEAGICYEEKIAFPPYKQPADRGEAVEFIKQDLEYISRNYFPRKNYLTVGGLPLVFLFNGSGGSPIGEKRFKPEELEEIIRFLDTKNALLVKQNLQLELRALNCAFMWPNSPSFDNIDWTYRTAMAAKTNNRDYLIVGMVYPGFNDSGVWGWGKGPRVDPRNDGLTYLKTWDLAIKYDPDMLQIVTWNDFEEGTVIEPTFQDRFKYANDTEKNLGRYKWHANHPEDNMLPFRLFQLRKAFLNYDKADKEKVKAELDLAGQSMFKKKPKETAAVFDRLADQMGWHFIDYYSPTNGYPVYTAETPDESDKYAHLFEPPSNLAANCPVESSSFREFGPEFAVDNSRDTRWSSDYNDGEWLIVDLGRIRTFSCVMIDWETAFAREYAIVTSDNKKDWNLVYKQENGKGGLETVTFPAVQARYVKFSGIKRATEWGFSFWEIGVFEKKPE
jgi:glycoprotein endo-alpha-1,2-mannosidase